MGRFIISKPGGYAAQARHGEVYKPVAGKQGKLDVSSFKEKLDEAGISPRLPAITDSFYPGNFP